MPLYEYQCSKCGKTFELMRKFSDPPVTVHDECGGAVEQLLSAPAFQLKGTGWYITDYAKKDSTSATKAGTAKEGSTSGDASPASASSGDSAASASAPSTPPAKPAKSE